MMEFDIFLIYSLFSVVSDEDAKLGADFEKTVNSIQERSSKNPSKLKTTKVCILYVTI